MRQGVVVKSVATTDLGITHTRVEAVAAARVDPAGRFAERRAGELLREMKERGELSVGGSKSREGTLNTLGVSKQESSRWQQLASIPRDEFDEVTRRTRGGAATALRNVRAKKLSPETEPNRTKSLSG